MSDQKHTLKRNIGLIALILFGVGDILGAGIYGLVGKAAGEMGYAAWLSFGVSMLAAGFTGLSYASLGSRYPRAGGAAYATLRAFNHRFLSYVVGLAVMASGLTSMATASRVFSGYLVGWFPQMSLEFVVIGFTLLVAGIVFRGIKESLVANGVCTIIELVGLCIVIAVGLPYLGGVDYLDATSPLNPTGQIALPLILSGAVLTFYSFIGFEDILNVSEEVKEPNKTVPRGLLAAVAISSVIYMTISLVAVSVIPPQELAASTQPLVDVVKKAVPNFPTGVFSLIALFAVANTALLNFVMASRLLYGMSNQGLLPNFLKTVHPKRHTPWKAIITVWVIFIALAMSGDISSLAKATSVLLLSCFIVVNLALVKLLRKEKIPGTFSVPIFVPIVGALICGAMLSRAKAPELTTAGILIAIIAAVYLIVRPSKKAIEAFEKED